jgi:hypothetical protein
MAVNDPERMLMVLHPSAKTILGANNLAFLHGPEHKAIRKSFLSLFTRKALSTYIQLQDGIIRGHLQRWLHTPDTREIRDAVRWAHRGGRGVHACALCRAKPPARWPAGLPAGLCWAACITRVCPSRAFLVGI